MTYLWIQFAVYRVSKKTDFFAICVSDNRKFLLLCGLLRSSIEFDRHGHAWCAEERVCYKTTNNNKTRTNGQMLQRTISRPLTSIVSCGIRS